MNEQTLNEWIGNLQRELGVQTSNRILSDVKLALAEQHLASALGRAAQLEQRCKNLETDNEVLRQQLDPTRIERMNKRASRARKEA